MALISFEICLEAKCSSLTKDFWSQNLQKYTREILLKCLLIQILGINPGPNNSTARLPGEANASILLLGLINIFQLLTICP